MDNIREIPGYYYDTDKKRYFKILPHASGSAYSVNVVKRRKIEDATVHTVQREKTRHERRIKVSDSLQDAFLGGILNRELGLSELDMPQVYARGLTEKEQMVLKRHDSPFFNAIPDQDSHLVQCATPSGFQTRRVQSDRRIGPPYLHSFPDAFHVLESDLTSMSANIGCNKMASTFMASTGNTGIRIATMRIPGGGDTVGATVQLSRGPGYSRGTEVDVLSSTAAPSSSSLTFAFGTSEGIVTMDRDLDVQYYGTRPSRTDISSKHDILAVEFLCDNPSVLLAGGRNGNLHIVDFRVPESVSETDLIRSPSAITHIKQLDPHRILVSGLESSLLQYDLRFRKHAAPSEATSQQSISGRRRKRNTKPLTLITLSYPEYHNEGTIRTGLDVNVIDGVLAAATDREGDDPMQLFSLHGGEHLKTPSFRTNYVAEKPVTCIQFVEDERSNTMSLWYMSAGPKRESRLNRFGWDLGYGEAFM